MAFHASYTIKETEHCLVEAFKKRNLIQSLSRDRRCMVQWTAFRRVNWSKMLEGKLLVSSYPVHSGIVRKVELFNILSKACEENGAGEGDGESKEAATSSLQSLSSAILQSYTCATASNPDALAALIESILSRHGEGTTWVCKASMANNATGVYIFSSLEGIQPLLNTVAEGMRNQTPNVDGYLSRGEWVIQKHIDKPLLVEGRKFHIRANVLAVGCLLLYFHEDVILHIASEEYRHDDWDNPWIHITNHVKQREHPSYNQERNTWRWGPFVEYMKRVGAAGSVYGDDGEALAAGVFNRMTEIARDTFKAFKKHRTLFFPIPGCFEVFGFDFMVDESGCVYLLEVNQGPGLEGHCYPTVCQQIVDDTISIVLDPLIRVASSERMSNSHSETDNSESEDSSFLYSCIPHRCRCQGSKHQIVNNNGTGAPISDPPRSPSGRRRGDELLSGENGMVNGFHLLLVDGPNDSPGSNDVRPILWSNALVQHVCDILAANSLSMS